MKKFICGLLAIVMLACSLLTLSGCSAVPVLDLDSVEYSLKNQGYEVRHTFHENSLSVEESLYAHKNDDYIYIEKCKTTSIAKISHKLLKLEYDQDVEMLKIQIKILKRIISTQKRDMTNQQIREYEDEIKDLQLELREYQKDYATGRMGKYVWEGTKDAVQDTWN